MNQTFGSILDRPSNTIEKPKPLPTGTYLCLVQGQPRADKSSKKQTEFFEYTLSVLQPQEDVDQEALAEMGGFSGKTIRATYYITEDALWRLKKFLVDDLLIEEADDDNEPKSLRQLAGEAQGRQVLATLGHRASEDGTTVYAELRGTAPVGE